MSAFDLRLDLHATHVRSARARTYLALALMEAREGRHELADLLLRRVRDLEATGSERLRLVEAPLLSVEDDGRTIVMPDGEVHDFSRRGPLRLMVLALAQAASGGMCLRVEDLVSAGYPNETLTPQSGRMRVHTAIRRLRRLGFEELLLTRDDGYLLDPAVTVLLDESVKV